MKYKHINVDSGLNKITRKDKLFLGDYTIDPYQNCEYGCIYCDSSFDKDVIIKNNITTLLQKELKKNTQGNIIIGSVNDPYQKIEEKEEKTKEILNLIKEHNFSCHILTKSDLVVRDIKILEKIKNCTVTVSISTINNKKKEIFENRLPTPETRLKIIKKLNENKIKAGLALIPVIPYLVEEEIEEILEQAKNYKASYFLFKYLELKGFQKDIFYKKLKAKYPGLLNKYKNLYSESYLPNEEYIKKTNNKIEELIDKYEIKNALS